MPLPHLALVVLAVLLAAGLTVALAAWVGPVAGLSVPALIVAALIARAVIGRKR